MQMQIATFDILPLTSQTVSAIYQYLPWITSLLSKLTFRKYIYKQSRSHFVILHLRILMSTVSVGLVSMLQLSNNALIMINTYAVQYQHHVHKSQAARHADR